MQKHGKFEMQNTQSFASHLIIPQCIYFASKLAGGGCNPVMATLKPACLASLCVALIPLIGCIIGLRYRNVVTDNAIRLILSRLNFTSS